MKQVKSARTFHLSFNSFGKLIWSSFITPFTFPSYIIKDSPVLEASFFFLINLFLGLFLGSIKAALVGRRLEIFFLGFGQNLLYLPVFLVFLAFFAGVLYLVAKIIGGDGSFSQTFKALSYSSLPIILFWLPPISFFGSLLCLILLIKNISYAQRLPLVTTLSAMIIPILIVLLLKEVFFT